MIEIRVLLDKQEQIKGFTAHGHAETAPRGQDIVCAAVSAITQTALTGLYYFDIECEAGEASGHLEVRVQKPDKTSEAILRTMLEGLKRIDGPLHIEEIGGVNHEHEKAGAPD